MYEGTFLKDDMQPPKILLNLSFQSHQRNESLCHLQERKNFSYLDEFPINMRKTKNNINAQTLNKVLTQRNETTNYDENAETKSNFKTNYIKNQLLASKVDLLKEIKSDQCNYYKYFAINKQLIFI